ncbi:MAG: hypothetical protein JRE38_04545, partial [Deltaproteobacteria bacterium]|nr:hypothetical protein [Deltaproteobacteria bacterium]
MANAALPTRHIRAERAVIIVLALLVVVGVVRAAALAWLCDDAFVSFRYADHLVKGIGLVYNEGEYVEGYTNLLWTLGIAAGMALGVSAEFTSMLLGIVCYVGLARTLAFAAWRRRERGMPFVPVAAAVVLVSADFHEWATGGLETMLFAWLATLGCLLAVRGRALPAGIAFALLTLTRPDGLLFAGAGAAACWLRAGGSLPRAATLLTPVTITLAVLLPWKLYYYGELLPTAFYSKSVFEPYWSQGLR